MGSGASRLGGGPAEPPEAKRRFPWFRAGVMLLGALVVFLIVVPFFHPIRVKTGAHSWFEIQAQIVPADWPWDDGYIRHRMALGNETWMGYTKVGNPLWCFTHRVWE